MSLNENSEKPFTFAVASEELICKNSRFWTKEMCFLLQYILDFLEKVKVLWVVIAGL